MKLVLLLALSLLLLPLVACEEKVECSAKAEVQYVCAGDDQNVSYRCPAGTAAQVANNAQIDADCEALGGTAVIDCTMDAMQDGKYEMVEAVLDEDCTASGTNCQILSGRCDGSTD